MNDDQIVCLCFGVRRRKLVQFIRTRRPRAVSQLSDCFGAGTGCGWCRPYLEQLWSSESPESETLPDAQSYAEAREQYRERSS
ncbi:(2Fe-2S)-binding protein [Roseiconus nitratireducens]|uniref:(2Fe-2S)-binding protein n=1 Tax=Roseiconus nitratireducens TaxID=2605748 RepID=A0A5M6DF27_9BACT|nr:(2Fe-2S)-binding protein [Roseiconus nitratireducens]KAA5546147.1 (2Fe-2S)-binding protein [Roseiconus nitratireducens]